ncbi:50S ribosomal protein l4 [Grosmannia clavigera kw1407]|uniref:Large ribosomal subunit protein uL4m n=1 Tax=Grosmannia clavigera (strain kw1407 / UAMH 11150) TaxID=655863 RepID=F0XE97_GROCL|nr:50S ribosomal protein l4 [Grosmannia clavigera kw1407]EFX04662.1 50S ribosomal protein l4 [Grosmannia clavigera kw1407]
MASRRSVRALGEAFSGLTVGGPCRTSSAPVPAFCSTSSRTIATTTAAPTASRTPPTSVIRLADRTVPVTVLAFPSLEPRSVEMWSAQHLHLPLRRDLLHLAVVYEGDNTRQGTASTKTRYDVHGSHRKMRPQKGTGSARLGSRQSPLIRGGGKSFGPQPRDFGTDLNRKVYDRAWRTALSYRYRRGELVVCEDGLELPLPDAFLQAAQAGVLDRELEDGFVRRYVGSLLQGQADNFGTNTIGTIGTIGQAWGHASGRTTFITSDRRPNLFTSLEAAGEHGRALTVDDVDVKDLLETGRIVVERAALRYIIERHQSDLVSRHFIHGVRPSGPPVGQTVVE